MPSKPGYEASSQTKPGRHTEVARCRRCDRSPPVLQVCMRPGLGLTRLARFAAVRQMSLLITTSPQSRYRRGSIRPVHGNKDAH
jgi:hypothetical protein